MGLVGVLFFPYVFPLTFPALSGGTQKERVKSLAPQRIADTKGNQRTAAAMHYVTQRYEMLNRSVGWLMRYSTTVWILGSRLMVRDLFSR